MAQAGTDWRLYMELENVLKLINAVSESSLTSFSMEDGDTKLSFGADRNTVNVDDILAGLNNDGKLNKSDIISCSQQGENNINDNIESIKKYVREYTNADINGHVKENIKENTNKHANENIDSEGMVINSPLVGVFYSAASPDDKAYVSVGDVVKKGQVIGIVEAMKLMNEIESDYDGVVTDILVNNEDMVEYGQPMFVISPA